MPFKPGESGNARGRPRTGTALAEYIRQLAGENGRAYVDVLHEIATKPSKDRKGRLTAINILLERGFGKSALPVELRESQPPMPLIAIDKLTDEEFELLGKIMGKAELPIIDVPQPKQIKGGGD